MKAFVVLCAVVLTFLGTSRLRAADEEEIERYSCLLGPRDHQSADGMKLTEPAQILRRDRENFHRTGKRDKDDEPDTYFADEAHRAEIAELLKKGDTRPAVYRAIRNGTPIVDVFVYRSHGVMRMRAVINDD